MTSNIAIDPIRFPIIARFAQINRSDELSLARQTAAILRIYSNADNFRDLLIDPQIAYDDATDDDSSMPLSRAAFAECAEYLQYALDDSNDYFTEQLTQIALELSLCPLHRIDYAICFDDDDPTCAQIRMIHPNHDT